MQRIASLGIILNSCSTVNGILESNTKSLTSSINKIIIELSREQRIRKFAEELLQQTGDTIYIVEEAFRVGKVDFGRIWQKG